jgi:hypothetical protein
MAQTAFFRSCNNFFGYLGTSGLLEFIYEIGDRDCGSRSLLSTVKLML